jgi:hypothetical protein
MSTIIIATLLAVEETEPSEPTTPPEPLVPVCEHIKDNGVRCGTPAIRGRHFCYYHSRAHRPHAIVGEYNYCAPIPESREALQIAVAHVLQALSNGKLERKVANSMFYGLHLATKILRMPETAAKPAPPDVVREITPAMHGILKNKPIPEPADSDLAYIQELVDQLLTLDQIEENYVELRKGESNYYYREASERVDNHYAAWEKLRCLGILEKYRALYVPDSVYGPPGSNNKPDGGSL